MSIPKEIKIWKDEKKGIGKECLAFTETKRVITPTELSRVKVKISSVQNLGNRISNYLQNTEEPFTIQMGSSLNPIDYYVETLLLNCKQTETCRCFIRTTAAEITFTMEIQNVEDDRCIYKLSPKEVLDLAKKFKSNGVEMYKKYPKFAEDYFSRAAKFLISFKPFEPLIEEEDGVEGDEFEELLQNLYLNMAASKIKDGEYEDVIFLTEFVENSPKIVSEKAVYRRALALCNLKKYDESKDLLDKYEFSKTNADIVKLYSKIHKEWKVSEDKYASFVKKMFQ